MAIFGTRPEVIKLAPVINQLEKSSHFDSVIVTTGQHREMLGQALDQFGITPEYNLDIMKPLQAVSDVTVDSLRGIEQLIALEKPDLVLVQGDTTSAFAGCLAAFYQKTAVGHVEAGLRTYDKYRPFPEEINRSLITQLADLHFVPTVTAWESLRREGIPEDRLFITGNTVIDALFHVVNNDYEFKNPVLQKLDSRRRLLVVTSHRRENFGRPLRNICDSVLELVEQFPDVEVVFSVHRNPKVNIPVRTLLGSHKRIHLVEPLEYADMANLLALSYLVLTDSGGLQEEAPALAKPVLVLRDTTERPEAMQAGLARLVGTTKNAIVAMASELLSDSASYTAMARGLSPYGDGQAATRIIGSIEYFYEMRSDRPAPFLSVLATPVSGDGYLSEKPISNDIFYHQLDQYIEKARRERQTVSVATFDLGQGNDEQFAHAVRAMTRSLRDTDTATAVQGVNGKRLVLILPGAGELEARSATDRLRDHLAKSLMGRRATDHNNGKFNASDGFNWNIRVDIKTFGGEKASPGKSVRPARSGREGESKTLRASRK